MTQITYQSVSTVCETLQAAGQTPSVRKVRAQIGGSFSTISEYLTQWRLQTQQASSASHELSAALQKALLAEFSQIESQAHKANQSTIDTLSSDLADANKAVLDCEKIINEQKTKIHQLMEQARSDLLEHEKKVAAAESAIDLLNAREAVLTKKIDELTKETHAAQVKEAIAQTQAMNFQERLKEIEARSKKDSPK